MKRLFTSICLAACTTAAFTSIAAADTSDSSAQVVSQVVHVGDLDLQTQDGAKRAAFRIRVAATNVCGGQSSIFRESWDFDTCRNHAIDRALATLQAPLVSAALGRPTPVGLASR
jgi:UrcA family protein